MAALDGKGCGCAECVAPIRPARGAAGFCIVQWDRGGTHSGRENEEGGAAPIARETLETLSGISRRAQIAYEARAGVRAEANYAIGEPATTAAAQERAWEKGNAVFEFTDYKGKRGEKNARYLAWQLPNSYRGPHEQRSRGRQRQFNQQLADLRLNGDMVTEGYTVSVGNGRQKVERSQDRPERRYYGDGRAA